jgi:hypothetical protein
MKMSIRKLIREFIQEMDLEEDYPASFSMETFKSLGSHAGRNRYAAEHLEKIGTGSSRIVYKIDNEKVLKLAKNDKGVSQNETEIQWGNDSYFGDILANIFDYDDRDLWVEMELARKINKHEFKRLTNFDINDVSMYFRNWEYERRGKRGPFGMDPELKAKMDADEFLSSVKEFSQSADIEIGDFGVATSYGVVRRNNEDRLVIIDYGLTKDVYSTHYEKKPARMWESKKKAPSSKSYFRAQDKNIGKIVTFEPSGEYEAVDEEGDPIYVYDDFLTSDISETAASNYIGGAVMGNFSMHHNMGAKVVKKYYIYQINEKPDVDISHWGRGDFVHLGEVRYRRPVVGKLIGVVNLNEEQVKALSEYYKGLANAIDAQWSDPEEMEDATEDELWFQDYYDSGNFEKMLKTIRV